MNYLTAPQAAKALGVSVETVRNMDLEGKLRPDHRNPRGYRFYTQEQIDTYLRIDEARRLRRTIRPLVMRLLHLLKADAFDDDL